MATAPEEITRALRMIGGGSYVLTAAHDQKRCGIVANSVQVCTFEPPLVCAAAGKGHPIGPIIRDSRRFAVCAMGRTKRALLRRFGVEMPETGDPFDGLEVDKLLGACPVLKSARFALECEVYRRVDLECECELYIGRVLAARVYRDRA
jgi:flavin reductase (DIM6/NTAB) family NADH-FMN oxidoreductase RutF